MKKLPIKMSIPEEFYAEEERCGFLVTQEMKRIWAIELDLLNELSRVCSKHGIEFYAEGGTLLGCIRHKGFIPWDDDIDVAVTRANYDKLCAVAYEFQHPYFFQTEQTDPGSLRGHAQLRNSLTTGALASEGSLSINQGIFIDIFPMDNVPDNSDEFEKQKTIIREHKNRALRYGKSIYLYDRDSGSKRIIKKALIGVPFFKSVFKKVATSNYEAFEKACKKYDATDTRKCSLLSFMCDNNAYIRDRSAYREVEMKPFEFMQIPVPVGYDHILTTQYGDYMELIKGNNNHGSVLFDVFTSYKEIVGPKNHK